MPIPQSKDWMPAFAGMSGEGKRGAPDDEEKGAFVG
jgi:hypothetical protein